MLAQIISFFSNQTLLQLLFQYRYLILYPVTIIEGPVVTIAAGFLVSLRVMNAMAALAIVVAGDMTSDLFFYCLGYLSRAWQRLAWVADHFRFKNREEQFVNLFNRHGGKMVIVGKLAHALAGIVFMGTGYFKINPGRVAWYSFAGALIKAVILMYVGYLAGFAYEAYAQRLEWWALVLSVGSVVLVATFFYLPRSIREKILGSEKDIIPENNNS